MINSQKSLLYIKWLLILLLNQYLYFDFKDLLIKTLFLSFFSLLILHNSFLLYLHMTSIEISLLLKDLLIEYFFDL